MKRPHVITAVLRARTQHTRKLPGTPIGLLALGAAPDGAADHADGGPPLGFEQVPFVKRQTYNANHYYTEFINSSWKPGGNLCVLNLKDGSVREVVRELKDGVFERFDLSYDARREL